MPQHECQSMSITAAGYKLNSQSKCSAGIYRSKDMYSGETGNYDSNYTTCEAVLKGQHHNINSMK